MTIIDPRTPSMGPSDGAVSVNRRRVMNMLVKAATVAVATPAIVAPVLAEMPSTPLSAAPAINLPTLNAPTKIEKLWRKRAAIYRRYRKARKTADNLWAEYERRLPAPDPSIVYSEANDADDLKWHNDCIDPPKSISASIIDERIRHLGMTIMIKAGDGTITIVAHPNPVALTEDMVAIKARLEARLEIARRF